MFGIGCVIFFFVWALRGYIVGLSYFGLFLFIVLMRGVIGKIRFFVEDFVGGLYVGLVFKVSSA